MYKDKEKQKEADRERARRYRQRQKGVTKTEGVTPKGVTNSGRDDEGVTQPGRSIPCWEVTSGIPPTNPLAFYSAARWAELQAKGYGMPEDSEDREYDGQLNLAGEIPLGARLGYARKVVGPGPTYQFAVPVPGDPGYEYEEAEEDDWEPGLNAICVVDI